jgi:hypothetical protein
VGESIHPHLTIIMNKFYLSVLSLLALGTGAIAQSKSQMPLSQRVKPTLDAQPHTFQSERGGVSPIWSDDFSDASTWVIEHAASAPALDWQIGIGLVNTGTYPTAPIESTTSSNGYAMLDSDGFANQSQTESSYMTMAQPVDLSAVNNVVFQFESFYRKWTDEECYVVVSTNNTDWPELTPTTDITALPNVFKAWPGMEVQAVISNPTLVRINISAAAGGQSQVWVRFHWTGTYGYSWFVDDAAIIEQPANDVVLSTSFLSHTGNGEEYGRIPSSQLNPTMLVGGQVYNFGYDVQSDIALDLEVLNANDEVVFNYAGAATTLASADTVTLEMEVNIPALENGLYRSIATVTSSQEQDGSFFSNNNHLRNFEVIDEVYSLDGIGIHPDGYQALGSIGTNSFTDGADGLMVFSYYEVAQELDVYGIEFLITSTTLPGGAVIAALHDSVDVRAGVVTNAIAESDIADVTQADIDAGFVRILFSEAVSLPAGGYYAGLELFSNDSTSPIRVVNDLTVPQPALASMIYIPDDNVYTNGNAMAIRLMLENPNAIGDVAALEGVSMYPNPSNGIVNIRTTQLERLTVEVFNVMGENVLTTAINGNSTIDLGANAKGVYMIRVSNGNAFTAQRIVVN